MTALIRRAVLTGLMLSATTANAINTYYVSDYATPQAAIDDAELDGGGLVRFPCGTTTLSAGLIVDAAGVTLEGCGLGGTTLLATFSTGDIIALGKTSAAYSFCGSVRDMNIKSAVTRTSGYAIAIAGCEKGTIENVHIENPDGGHGIHFGNTSGAHAHLVRVNNVTIENRGGAFTAIRIDSGQSRYFTNLNLRGPAYISEAAAVGSRGIVITQTGGDAFVDVESNQFEVGVLLSPPTDKIVEWTSFVNVSADQNTVHGFQFLGSGSGLIQGISCVRCWSGTNGLSTINGRGFIVHNGRAITITDSWVVNNGGHGIDVWSAATDVEVSGGVVMGNCRAVGTGACTAGWAHGIVFNGVDGFRIRGVRTGSLETPLTQGYGIYLSAGCNNFIVSENDTRNNVTSGIFNGSGTGATKILKDNL